MGCVPNMTADTFPGQGTWLGRKVKVCFNYEINKAVLGVIIREDNNEPFETLIRIDAGPHTGKVVRSAECQYSPEPLEK